MKRIQLLVLALLMPALMIMAGCGDAAGTIGSPQYNLGLGLFLAFGVLTGLAIYWGKQREQKPDWATPAWFYIATWLFVIVACGLAFFLFAR